MQPIVNGIKKEFKACAQFEKANFHTESKWSILISPIGTPEFTLLDSSMNILYRWVGFTEKNEFVEVMKPLCYK
jgi:hypothetical protein